MSLVQAVILGLLQGLTEFFPVSSSAHLELMPWLVGWDLFGGDAEMENTFDVAVHVGTLVGAAVYLRRDIARYASALWRAVRSGVLRGRPDASDRPNPPDRSDAIVALSLAVSAVPAALIGVALEDRLLSLAEEPLLIAASLAGFGWLLWWSDARATAGRQQSEFGIRDALTMGAAQAAALLPGVSRSGVTMTAGRWLGFDRAAAARLSFLMSLPVIAGAGVYRAGTLSAAPTGSQIAVLSVGGVTAALSSWAGGAAMLWLLRRTGSGPPNKRRSPFALFAGYRTAVAIVVLLVIVTGLR